MDTNIRRLLKEIGAEDLIEVFARFDRLKHQCESIKETSLCGI